MRAPDSCLLSPPLFGFLSQISMRNGGDGRNPCFSGRISDVAHIAFSVCSFPACWKAVRNPIFIYRIAESALPHPPILPLGGVGFLGRLAGTSGSRRRIRAHPRGEDPQRRPRWRVRGAQPSSFPHFICFAHST